MIPVSCCTISAVPTHFNTGSYSVFLLTKTLSIPNRIFLRLLNKWNFSKRGAVTSIVNASKDRINLSYSFSQEAYYNAQRIESIGVLFRRECTDLKIIFRESNFVNLAKFVRSAGRSSSTVQHIAIIIDAQKLTDNSYIFKCGDQH
jgi:hypothetical protein